MLESTLEVTNLSVTFLTAKRKISAVSNVSLNIQKGEILGLVGETGCGKTTLGMALMGLLPSTAVVQGGVRLRGELISAGDEETWRRRRGRDLALIVQDPLSSLDPTFSVGSQVAEAIRAHSRIGRRDARTRAIELMELVGIVNAAERYDDPPHRFSGGMCQRIVIAIAIANDPSLLIADEPTTALDVTIQDQIIRLFLRLRKEIGMSVLFISHDLGVVRNLSDRVGVMYAGQLVELGPTASILRNPRHPYTQALLRAVPKGTDKRGLLAVIPGEVPNLENAGDGCRFAPRCPHRMPACAVTPDLTADEDSRSAVACWLYAEDASRPAPSKVAGGG